MCKINLLTHSFTFLIEYEPCPAWNSWAEILDVHSHEQRYYSAMGMYLLFGVSDVIFLI